MKNINMVWNYFYGNLNYYFLLRNHIYDDSYNIDISKQSINGAKIGMISNLMLGIKERLVEKKANLNYESKIFSEELERCVNIISIKKAGGYFIDGCYFENPSILTSTIRNKLAHGDFLLDLENSQVIFNIKGDKFKISIDKLTSFVILAVNNSLNRSSETKFKRMLVMSPHFEFKRHKSITELSDVKEFVKTLKKFEIEIYPKLGYKITKDIRDEFESCLKLFVSGCNVNQVFNFREKYKDQLIVKYNIEDINKSYVDKLSVFLYNITPTDESYPVQILSYLNEATRILNSDFEKDNLLFSFAKNILYLDTIYKANTYDKNKIFNKITEEYNTYYLNYDQLASSMLAMFSSLFVYPMEDLYDNPNLFKDDEIKGLDYSKLDMSLMDVEKYTIEHPLYDEVLIRKKSITKKLEKVNEDYAKNEESLEKVKGNAKVEEILKEKRIAFEEKIRILTIELTEINNKIIWFENYMKNNTEYLKNKYIIEGIRNSIAHGNYRIEIGTNMENSMLVFEDIYDNKLTFKSKITLDNFAKFCLINADIVFNKEMNKKYKK